jgi:hypothetical protein
LYKGAPANITECDPCQDAECRNDNEISDDELKEALDSFNDEIDIVEISASERSVMKSGEVSPKSLVVIKTGSIPLRKITGDGFSIELGQLDWKLVEHVAQDKIAKAMVMNQEWIVSKDDHNIRFKSAKPRLTVVVNAELLMYKLRRG